MRVGWTDGVERCLDDLERRIDAKTEDELLRNWIEFSAGRFKGDIFRPNRPNASAPLIEWPKVSINQALEHVDAMMVNQLAGCSHALEKGTNELLMVRSNYGTGILPTVFGAELFIMDEALDTLPTSQPMAGHDAIRKLVDSGVPDLRGGLGGKVLEMGRRFAETWKKYPKIGKHVQIYHPDLQGPMDVCELLWGSGIFLDLFDQPDLVHDLLRLITETHIVFMREWEKVAPARKDAYAPHWGLLHQGKIMIRDDSAMNLSPEMYNEFVRPYDAKLLETLGGGAIHFCGRGDHYIGSASTMKGLHAVNMSQPQYNDLELIFKNTVDKGINLLALERATAEAAIKSGRHLHGRVHCW